MELKTQTPITDEIRFLNVVECLELGVHGLFPNLEDLADTATEGNGPLLA